jgi:hypothetical protein
MTYILEADEMTTALTSWSEFYNMVSKSNFSDTGIFRAVVHYLPELKQNVSSSMEIPLSEVSVSPDDIAGTVSELIEYYAEHKKAGA